MDTKIIAFSGKSQSGKNTLCNFIIGHSMKSVGIIYGGFKITSEGKLFTTDIYGDNRYEGIFDVCRPTTAMRNFLAANLNKYVKLYSFADALKQDVCINLLGLDFEAVYGTNEQKNKPTHLKWENFPIPNKKSGFMSGREVMEAVGTKFFRNFYRDIWVKSTIKKIETDKPVLALICDVRFPNECDVLNSYNSLLIRLLRNPIRSDAEPENALNDYTNYNYTLDNSELDIWQSCAALYEIMKSNGFVKEVNNE